LHFITHEKEWRMDDSKTVVTVILDRQRKKALEKRFNGMGLNFSNGVRMVLYDYLDKTEESAPSYKTQD
jgi:hypothetical protein